MGTTYNNKRPTDLLPSSITSLVKPGNEVRLPFDGLTIPIRIPLLTVLDVFLRLLLDLPFDDLNRLQVTRRRARIIRHPAAH
jgi:hypothetical protein